MAHLWPSALFLSDCPFDLAQSESDVFAEPDAWYSTETLLSPHPGLREVEVLGEITRRQKVLLRSRVGRVSSSLFAFALVSVSQRAARKSSRPGI